MPHSAGKQSILMSLPTAVIFGNLLTILMATNFSSTPAIFLFLVFTLGKINLILGHYFIKGFYIWYCKMRIARQINFRTFGVLKKSLQILFFLR